MRNSIGPTILLLLLLSSALAGPQSAPQGDIRLLVRADDMGVAQAVFYLAVRMIFGVHFAAGWAGVPVLLCFAAIVALGFGAFGSFLALRTGTGEAVQAFFPVFFVLLFISSMNTPRDLIAVERRGGKIRTVANAGHVPAESRMSVVQSGRKEPRVTLLRLEPRTGRSHQLRVQCAKRGLPIVGDQTYGDFARNREFAKRAGTKRMFLHSLETTFDYEFGGASRSSHRLRSMKPFRISALDTVCYRAMIRPRRRRRLYCGWRHSS